MSKEKNIESKAQSKSGSPKEASEKPKRRNYKKELQQVVAERDEFKEKWLRTAAEFDNFRKRTNSEKPEWTDVGRSDVLTAVLSVLDDIQRFSAVDENKDYDALHKGVELIARNFEKVLTDIGLVEMETIDQPFDPEKHDALMQMPVDGKDADIVVEQHLKGYEFKDKVLRHAQVIVSK
jgi:molecular chaperone GrpE